MLSVVGSSDIPLIVTAVNFIALFINNYISRFLQLQWQFLLIENRIKKSLDFITQYFITSTCIVCAGM
jgi:hypothetical protein